MTTGRHSFGFGRWMKRTTGACALAFALAATGAATAVAAYEPPAGDPKQGEEEVKTDQVELVFKSGNTVKGTLISEDDASIKVRVSVAGISAETSYAKGDILAINRNLPVDGGDKPVEKKPSKKQPLGTVTGEFKGGEGDPKVYFLTLKGRFGRDVNVTPLEEIVADIKKHQPDFLIIKYDHTVQPMQDGEIREFLPNTEGLQQQSLADRLGLVLYDSIYLNPEWEKKPQMVAWVHRALGGATYLPFISPKIYYTSDGLHGGLGLLDRVFGHADEVVREKWRGAMLAGAEGMAIRGGHDPRLVRAMLRTDMVLSYKVEGGEAVLMERMPQGPSEFLLTDDGREENADSIQDIVRFKGNDALMLDAETAQRIGLSSGTADTLDELMVQLGVTGTFNLIKGDSEKIIEKWGKEIDNAEVNFRRLWRDFERAAQVEPPGGYKERSEARSRMISILRQVKSLVARYKESIDPEEIDGAPDNWMLQLDYMIDQLQQDQRRDKK